MSKLTIIIIVVVAIILVGIFLDRGIGGVAVGSLAPDFELEDYNGNKVKLSDFRGVNPVFVNFWASWCPFCIDEMPFMAEVQEEHANAYTTLAVNRGESLEIAKQFSDQVGVTGRYPLLLDKSDKVYSRYAGFAMPYSVFVDRDGVVQRIKHGPLTKEELEQIITNLLK